MEEDTYFDRGEDATDVSTVCTIIYGKLTAEFYITGQGSSKNPVISAVMTYVREGWPYNLDSEEICY